MRKTGTLLFSDRSEARDTVLLLSSGRSGSTWLADMIRSLTSTRMIFEPFHPRFGPPELSEHRYTYYDPSAEMAGLRDSLGALIDGTRRSGWTEQLNRPTDFLYSRRLLKMVRGNLMLPWLTANFPNYRYIFLIRHPAAVVASQLRGGWNLSSRRILAQIDNLAKFDLSGLEQFGWPEDGFLSNLVFWAAENEVALHHARESDVLIMHYEHLCMDPKNEMRRVESHLGVRFPDTLQKQFDTVSWSSRQEIGSMSAEEKISRWRGRISEQNLSQLQAVLASCSLSNVYDTGPLPLPAPAAAV